MKHNLIYFAVVVACFGFAAQQARAIPILQLYVEGGAYDDASETWVLTPPGSSAGVPFRLWAIGNIKGPGSKGPISDVKLSIAFDETFSDLQISLTPSRVGGNGVGSYGGFIDPTAPGEPVLNTSVKTSLGIVDTGPDGVVTNGGTPMLGDGTNLPTHGIFGEGTAWTEYLLGDFDTADSPVGDFIDSFPTTLYNKKCRSTSMTCRCSTGTAQRCTSISTTRLLQATTLRPGSPRSRTTPTARRTSCPNRRAFWFGRCSAWFRWPYFFDTAEGSTRPDTGRFPGDGVP